MILSQWTMSETEASGGASDNTTKSCWSKFSKFIISGATLLGLIVVVVVLVVMLLSGETRLDQQPGGIGFRPMDEWESQLIWFRAGDRSGNWENWVKRYEDDFLQVYYDDAEQKEYRDSNGFSKQKVDCSVRKPGEGEVCMIKREGLFQGDCTPDNHYGFRDGKPCIALKLNKIYNWVPERYSETETVYHKPPKKFPAELNTTYWENIKLEKPEENNRVWVECHWQDPADVENLGEVNYYPYHGFNANFYPYLNQDKYLEPIVFMQMRNPYRGVIISIECKAWAKNIDHNSGRGMAQFAVLID